MQLVLEYQQSDGYTYSCTNTLPVEYESVEALAVDLEAAMRKAHDECEGDITFAGHQLDVGSFFYNTDEGLQYDDPRIFTIAEWFKYHDQGK